MDIIISALVLGICWFIGVIGWAQVIGSFQNLESNSKYIITIIIWLAIIIGTFFIVQHFFSNRIIACVIGLVVSLIQVLREGKIE